jgi:poly-gamma-glutamate capsule biosynthesis protein CapA/YwtB (metallophosphatase superfamily)
MSVRIWYRAGALIAAAALVVGCLTPNVTPAPTQVAVAPTPSATVAPTASASPLPSATPAGATTFPLAVVTGLTNLRGGITIAELSQLANAGKLLEPCGIEVSEPALTPADTCVVADQIATKLQAQPQTIALLPPRLVQPATKTLPIDGKGPFGLFGADLFGDPAARAIPYPIQGRAMPGASLDPAWTAYDPTQVWDLSSVGGVCSDRGSAWQALHLGKGWPWLFDGGTAKYRGKPYLNPSPPEGISREVIVSPVETGHAGTLARLIKGADLTIADVECPIVPTSQFVPNYGRSLTFSISEAVLPLWKDTFGFDVAYMAANHNTDKGRAGVASSIQLLDRYGIEHVGVGLDYDQAMKPAIVERAGVKMAFVAWNDVPGVTRATSTSAGVPWITKANIVRSVRLARAAGAQLVFCDPQWWGGAEYHLDLQNAQLDQLKWFDEAGCDEVIGAGTHFAGPMLLQQLDGHLGLVMASEGNLVFGQDWWQLTQEGVLMTVTFRGTQLANVHVYPYVMVFNARSDLTNPQADGHYVMDRLWDHATTDYLATAP